MQDIRKLLPRGYAKICIAKCKEFKHFTSEDIIYRVAAGKTNNPFIFNILCEIAQEYQEQLLQAQTKFHQLQNQYGKKS